VKVRADREICIGSGLCVLRLPELFDQRDDDGTVLVLRTEPDPDQERIVLDAIAACPGRALRVDR
jgi:ferredoxin